VSKSAQKDEEDDDEDEEETTTPAAPPGKQGPRRLSLAHKDDDEDDDDDDDDESEPTVAFGAEADVLSRYIWRGITLSTGPVLQPSTFVRVKGLELSAMGNLVLTDPGEEGRFNEVDLDLRYKGRWRRWTFEPIAYGYLYPYGTFEPIAYESIYPYGNRVNTLEAAFRVTCSLGLVDFFTEHAVDVISYLGAYYGELGLLMHYRWHGRKSAHWSLAIEGGSSIAVASDRFNDAHWGVPKTTLDLVGFNGALTYYPVRHFYLRPHFELAMLTDLDLRAAAESPDTWVVGQAIGLDFDF
jgi:hypothetical protein